MAVLVADAEGGVVKDTLWGVAEGPEGLIERGPHWLCWRARAAFTSAAEQCSWRHAPASAWNWAEAQTHLASVKAHPLAVAAGPTHARMQGVIPRVLGTAELDAAVVTELWALAETARMRREMSFVAENMTGIVGM